MTTEPAAPLRRTSESAPLAGVLAAAAGSVEAYSVIALGAFAGAQTGNVVIGSVELSHAHLATAARYLWPILAFIGGVVLAQTLQTARVAARLRRPYRALLALELVILVVVGSLPASTPHVVASVVITVAVAAQAATFRKVVDIGYNSAFTTGNLMNAVVASYAAIVSRDHRELVHARRIGAVIACYALGAVLGGLCTHAWHHRGIWCGAVILSLALALFVADERRHRQSQPE